MRSIYQSVHFFFILPFPNFTPIPAHEALSQPVSFPWTVILSVAYLLSPFSSILSISFFVSFFVCIFCLF